MIQNCQIYQTAVQNSNSKRQESILWNQVKSRMETFYSELILFALMFTLLANVKKVEYLIFATLLENLKFQIRGNISIRFKDNVCI